MIMLDMLMWRRRSRMRRRRRTDPKTAPHILCEPAQSKRTWTFHKSHFMQKFTGKRPQTKSKQNSRRKLCASPRFRNAHGHDTRESYADIHRKNAGAQSERLDQTPALP